MKLATFKDKLIDRTSDAIFAVRWLLAPMYLLLYVALIVYLLKYSQEILNMILEFKGTPPRMAMLAVIELIDMTMIANLVVMTTTGGYSIFVREFKNLPEDDRPRWLTRTLSSGEQKIKLGASLVGVALVNMLPTFIEADHIDWATITKQIAIIGVFMIGTLVFCWVNILSHSADHNDSHPMPATPEHNGGHH
jgi:uncharacterized protein (TIGR00645 family)